MDLLSLLIGFLDGYFFIVLYEMGFNFIHKKSKKEPIVRFKGYHLHHSLYGLGLLFLFLIIPHSLILGSGLGIIVRHTHAEKKFTFIDKS